MTIYEHKSCILRSLSSLPYVGCLGDLDSLPCTGCLGDLAVLPVYDPDSVLPEVSGSRHVLGQYLYLVQNTKF